MFRRRLGSTPAPTSRFESGSLAAAGCDLLTPWLTGAILDLTSRPERRLTAALAAALAMITVQACAHLCRWRAQRVLNRSIPVGMAAIGTAVFSRLPRLEEGLARPHELGRAPDRLAARRRHAR